MSKKSIATKVIKGIGILGALWVTAEFCCLLGKGDMLGILMKDGIPPEELYDTIGDFLKDDSGEIELKKLKLVKWSADHRIKHQKR